MGGNVRASRTEARRLRLWVVGVQDPDGGSEYAAASTRSDGQRGSVVTSGDYQRYYYVDGVKYHHIIDPETLYPATLWRAVTVVCEDSGLADALSTSLFTMTQDEGQALLDEFGAEALWVAAERAAAVQPGLFRLYKRVKM